MVVADNDEEDEEVQEEVSRSVGSVVYNVNKIKYRGRRRRLPCGEIGQRDENSEQNSEQIPRRTYFACCDAFDDDEAGTQRIVKWQIFRELFRA